MLDTPASTTILRQLSFEVVLKGVVELNLLRKRPIDQSVQIIKHFVLLRLRNDPSDVTGLAVLEYLDLADVEQGGRLWVIAKVKSFILVIGHALDLRHLVSRKQGQGLVGLTGHIGVDKRTSQVSADWVVDLGDGVQLTEENDWAHQHQNDKDDKTEAHNDLLPLLDARAQSALHVVLIDTLGNVKISLHLRELDPLEGIKSRRCEGPVD